MSFASTRFQQENKSDSVVIEEVDDKSNKIKLNQQNNGWEEARSQEEWLNTFW